MSGYYGAALIAATFQGSEEMASLLLNQGADINVVGGYYGTALTAAAYQGHEAIVSWLLNRDANINIVGGHYGSALAAAVSSRNMGVVSLLLNSGADITTVLGEYGTVLGKAAYEGDDELVSLLLDCGADVEYVGGHYETMYGEYPTALHTAQSGTATLGLVTLLERVLAKGVKALDQAPDCHVGVNGDLARRPPFPMPYTPASTASVVYQRRLDSGEESTSTPTTGHFQAEFDAGGIISIEQADFPCKALDKEVLMHSLVALVGIHREVAEHCKGWIQNDIRYFVSQNFDFGLAYAAARVGWKNFNSVSILAADISIQRDQWRKRAKKLDEDRARALYTDNTQQELLQSPYSVMPRRLWDLKSDRVVDFRMLHAEIQSSSIKSTQTCPTFWAVTHSWSDSMEPVATSINQYQWKVPLPPGVDLEDEDRTTRIRCRICVAGYRLSSPTIRYRSP